MAYGADAPVHVIARGEGSYVWDTTGHRLLDGLSGLFTVQVGHGRPDLAEAARVQAETLEYFPIWTYAHPPAIELAARLASLAPGDLDRVFFTSGGSEAVESAWKLARQYFRAIGQGQRHKVIARRTAYHGTTLGALAITGIPALRTPFEPLTPGAVHVANTNRRRHPLGDDEKAFMLAVTDEIEERILFEGPETVAAVFLEPVQNAGGCLVPPDGYFPRVREICDRYGVLLVSDEVICAFGRLGTMFGCERYDYLPDIITCAKGLTSGYSPLGAVLCRDFLAEPFLEHRASFAHGITFGGHPVSCAVALANLDVFDREACARPRVRARSRVPRSARGPARPPDRRRRARRGVLPGARAGARPGLGRALHRRAARGAAARLPRSPASTRTGSSRAPTTAATPWCSSRRR